MPGIVAGGAGAGSPAPGTQREPGAGKGGCWQSRALGTRRDGGAGGGPPRLRGGARARGHGGARGAGGARGEGGGGQGGAGDRGRIGVRGKPRHGHIAEAVEGEVRLVDFLSLAIENVPVRLAGPAEVAGVEITVSVEYLGVAEGDGRAGRSPDGEARPTREVLAEGGHRLAGRRLPGGP